MSQHSLRPIELSDLDPVRQAAHADGHATITPTQVLEKHGEIYGAASIGAVVLVLPWFSREKCTARDSLTFIRLMEEHIRETLPPQYSGMVCVPFVPHSRFHPHMQRLGYTSAGLVDLGFKWLRKPYQ